MNPTASLKTLRAAVGPLTASIGGLMLVLAGLPGSVAMATVQTLATPERGQIIEALAPRLGRQDADPVKTARNARQAIEQARQSADPRYLGRAQAILGRWWNRDDAPVELAVLQATVMQSRHEFAPARALLVKTLRRAPSDGQAWLTLATLERVAGRYPLALAACAQVAAAGAPLYAQACELETRSLLGEHALAQAGLMKLATTAKAPELKGWLYSLLAEAQERAGDDTGALKHFRLSLALSPDGYSALASSDLLLRRHRPAEALEVLRQQPESDAVLLRRARALQQLGDPAFRNLQSLISDRFKALERRGDDPVRHAREAALFELWFGTADSAALQVARSNLDQQKEPFDWWLAMSLAARAGQTDELRTLRAQLQATGLKDARLMSLATGGAS